MVVCGFMVERQKSNCGSLDSRWSLGMTVMVVVRLIGAEISWIA